MKMNYFVLGTNDKARAIAFYDALFADHPVKQLHNEGRMTLWAGEGFMFAIAEPFDGNPATVGNGSMLGLQLDTQADVDRLHQLALDLGGSDEGTPQIRSGYYSAYIRDLDGNKICLYL